jgi:hypothetical protein
MASIITKPNGSGQSMRALFKRFPMSRFRADRCVIEFMRENVKDPHALCELR